MTSWQAIALIWSYKRELKLVLASFLVLLSLPVIAVFILVHTGVNVVSDALVGVNPETKTVEVYDPTTGEVMDEIEQAIAWPVTGIITLEFAQSSGYQVFHTGLDIANALGTPISPMMEGTVTYAGEIFWGYGKHIIIEHGNNLTTIYAHLDKIFVYEGQEVHIGDQIGNMGSTGWSTGSHLHLETRMYGVPVNPRVFLDAEHN